MFKIISIFICLIFCQKSFAEVVIEKNIKQSNDSNDLALISDKVSILKSVDSSVLVEATSINEKDDIPVYYPIAARYVKKPRIIIYSEPSTNSTPLFELPQNTKVYIYDRINNWELISLPSGPSQWIQSDYLCQKELTKVDGNWKCILPKKPTAIDDIEDSDSSFNKNYESEDELLTQNERETYIGLRDSYPSNSNYSKLRIKTKKIKHSTGTHYVSGYYRKNGSYVKSHWRSKKYILIKVFHTKDVVKLKLENY